MADLTTHEAPADPDVYNLGKVEDCKEKEAVGKMVDKIKQVVQDKADKGETKNQCVIWTFLFPGMRGSRLLPTMYRNEETNTNISSRPSSRKPQNGSFRRQSCCTPRSMFYLPGS